MCHHSETSSMWVWHWRVIVKGQTTSGSVVAVEPILKVNPRLTDDIIGPHEIVVHYSDNQLCFQWERYREFKHPERKGKACRDVRRSVKSECVQMSIGRKKHWLSKRRVELLRDVSVFGVQNLLSNADQQIRVGFTVQVCGSQIGGLQGKETAELSDVWQSSSKPQSEK